MVGYVRSKISIAKIFENGESEAGKYGNSA
jgi:hypothetical protein